MTPMSCVGVFCQHRLLLIQRSLSDSYPGLWNLPGGKAESGERPEDTALRELREETGIDASVSSPILTGLARRITSYETDRGRVTLFLAIMRTLPWIRLESVEVLGFGWFDLDSVAALPKLGMAPGLAVREYRRVILEEGIGYGH